MHFKQFMTTMKTLLLTRFSFIYITKIIHLQLTDDLVIPFQINYEVDPGEEVLSHQDLV